jgi:hypothetical protein
VRQDCMAVFQFDLEHGVRKRLADRAFEHDGVFLGLGQGFLLLRWRFGNAGDSVTLVPGHDD